MKRSILFAGILWLLFGIFTASAATIPLQWDAVTEAGVTELRVYELTQTGRVLLSTLPPSATSYNVTKTPGKYSFTVVAYNGFWESADFDVLNTPDPPGKVRGLRFGVIIASVGIGVLLAFGGIKKLIQKIF